MDLDPNDILSDSGSGISSDSTDIAGVSDFTDLPDFSDIDFTALTDDAPDPAKQLPEPVAAGNEPASTVPEYTLPDTPSGEDADTLLAEILQDEEAGESAGTAKKKPAREKENYAAEGFSADDTAEKKKKRRAIRKGRPRRRKGEGLLGIPNMIVTAVWCALILVIGVTLGRMLWLAAADILAFGKSDQTVTITIEETDSISDIARKLKRLQLIEYPELFKLYASFAVDDGDIHAGEWELNTKYDYHALVNGMAPSSTKSVVTVMIPEGYTCKQIFALLETNKVCSAEELGEYAASGELGDYWFLRDVTRGSAYCLEGFLFPDTYEFYTNDSARSVLTKMLNNFNNKFGEDMIYQIDQLNQTLASMMRQNGKSEAYISENTFTVKEVVIVASMIEKETSSAEEGYTIASVIYNRLFNWGTNPAYLNIDATIVYALDGKNDLTTEDLRVDSPYNTYTNIGLTPGPISNPGLSSLKAALAPLSTNYYYYVLDPSAGSHIFATTQAEHEANVANVRQ